MLEDLKRQFYEAAAAVHEIVHVCYDDYTLVHVHQLVYKSVSAQ